MTDEKRRKKFGLSLKTSKKIVIENNEESKAISKELTKHICHGKSKTNSLSKMVVIDIDDFSDLNAQQSKSNHETKTETDSVSSEKEKLLWRNMFSSERQVSWENLEDLPKFDVVASMKKQDDANVTATDTTKQMLPIKDYSKDQSSDDVDYIELPKPCVSCYTRKPVQLDFSETEEIAIPQSTEKEVGKILANEEQESNINYSTFYTKNDNNCNPRTTSPVTEDIDDCEMLSILDDEPLKRKFTDCDQDWQSNFHQTKKRSIEQNRTQCGKVDSINLNKEIKHRKQDEQSNIQKNKSNSIFHEINNDNNNTNHHKFSSHAKSYSVSRVMNYQENYSRQQTHNFSQKTHSNYIQRKDLVPERSIPRDNIVIDLTDDKAKTKSCTLDYETNRTSQKPKKLDQSSTFKRQLNSHKSLIGERKLSNERLSDNDKERSIEKELKTCPMCQLKFSCRTSKQDIERHISSCIGDEVIVDDNSDEDWLFSY